MTEIIITAMVIFCLWQVCRMVKAKADGMIKKNKKDD